MTFTDRALVAGGIDPDVSASLQIYERIKPIRDALGVQDLSDNELQLFAIVARHTGLDPFTKQIYAIKRAGKVTHQTGIDGYRAVAERTGQYAGSDEATFEECPCDQMPKPHPSVARVVVHRVLASGHVVDQVGVARWHELKPQGGSDAMWMKMPYNQLAKCAEANGLRKAFPRVLGGVYITEEMQGADVIEGEASEAPSKPAPATVADRIAARRAERESSPPIVVEPTPTASEEPSEAADEPQVAAGGSGEPPATAPLSKAEFVRRLGAAGIDRDHAGLVRLVMFPDVSQDLTDEDRGALWTQLEAEKKAEAATA